MECKAMFVTPLKKGIKQVAFSKDGRYLVASAMDDEHQVAIFDWAAKPKGKTGTVAPVAHGKGTRANILSIGFNPTGDQVVATCVKEVNFFSFAGGVIKGQKGTGWGTKGADSVLTQAFVGNVLFTGSYTGEIITWQGRNIGKRQKAHTGRVNCLWPTKSNGLISGAHDGLVVVWAV